MIQYRFYYALDWTAEAAAKRLRPVFCSTAASFRPTVRERVATHLPLSVDLVEPLLEQPQVLPLPVPPKS